MNGAEVNALLVQEGKKGREGGQDPVPFFRVAKGLAKGPSFKGMVHHGVAVDAGNAEGFGHLHRRHSERAQFSRGPFETSRIGPDDGG